MRNEIIKYYKKITVKCVSTESFRLEHAIMRYVKGGDMI